MYEWVKRQVWTSHVTHMNESCPTDERGWATKCLMWMSHVTHMIESCHTYEWVMSHTWMSHVTHMNESCYTRVWVMPQIWMSHVTRELCHTFEWVMSHIWTSHVTHGSRFVCRVTHIIQSCHTYEWVMSHMMQNLSGHGSRFVGYATHVSKVVSHTWRSHVAHDAGCRWWRVTVRDTHPMRVILLRASNSRSHSHMWHSSTSHRNTCHELDESFTQLWVCRVTLAIRAISIHATKFRSHLHMCHSSTTSSKYVSRTQWVIYTFVSVSHERVMSHIWMNHVTHMNESCHIWYRIWVVTGRSLWVKGERTASQQVSPNCAAICCRCVADMLQCVAVCCSMLQCVASMLQRGGQRVKEWALVVLQCVAVCCSVLQMWCSVL